LLAAPNRELCVPDLLGDPEGRMSADASMRGERRMDGEGVQSIRRALEDLEATAEATGWTEPLEERKAALLAQLKYCDKQVGSELKTAHHNIASQLRSLGNELRKDMPKLTGHLKQYLDLTYPSFRYAPPFDAPAWDVVI
jgi:hypothetical protein